MPIGVIVNVIAVILGGITGTMIGPKLKESFKENLNLVFGACALTMGVNAIMNMQNMPAVIFAVIAGTAIGLGIHLGDRIQGGARMLQKGLERLFPANSSELSGKAYDSMLVTAIVLCCASGTGIYGTMVSGMTGDHSILFAKSILDFPTGLIFACSLGIVTSFIAIPQFVIFMLLYLLSGVILPLCTDVMIGDFRACGGVLLLATGFRMMKVREFPIADMIPAMVLVMPVSWLWSVL